MDEKKSSTRTRTPRPLPRRDFLSAVAAGTLAAVATGWTTPGAAAAQPAAVPKLQGLWLDRLGGSHGQFFDMPSISGGKALQQSRNFLDAYRDAFEVQSEDIDLVIGLHGSAAVLAFDDFAWREFGFGDRTQVRDPGTGQSALRNVFLGGGGEIAVPEGASIQALQKRGAIFLLCNNAFKRLIGELERDGYGPAEAIRTTLLAHLLPDLEIVPALVVAVNQAHEKGLSYVYAG